MSDDSGKVLGIRLRFPDGRKLAVPGGREGLFIPQGLAYSGPLLVAEGPTDTAALLDLGYEAIGRPCCTGGVGHCIEIVRGHQPLAVVIVADADAPGQRGAEALATAILPYAASVRVIQPPEGVKDAREWKRVGGTQADVSAAIEAAVGRHLSVKVVRHG
ncbi:MAG: hypothetical protein NTV86_10235 [Planctomycetota bacterium]|nr:hypothetical protein [Planctomycetota bacterium]